ncbi:MAG: P-II family nitrogen regulator [Microcystaceae cyanobacterium]
MLESVKKVEIIVSQLEVSAVLKIIKKNGIERYTIINNVSGWGEHGRYGDDLITNSCIMIICSNSAVAEQLSEAMQPLLKKLGGIFIITDAQWIAH